MKLKYSEGPILRKKVFFYMNLILLTYLEFTYWRNFDPDSGTVFVRL